MISCFSLFSPIDWPDMFSAEVDFFTLSDFYFLGLTWQGGGELYILCWQITTSIGPRVFASFFPGLAPFPGWVTGWLAVWD